MAIRLSLAGLSFAFLVLACSNGIFQGSGSGGPGTLAPGFTAGGFPNDEVYAIAVNSDNGDIYVGGK
ncbi:MAG: hypothetical protein KDD51_16095, partial [Bdellovibrionales bacterium]|nr:hypothetical protein [Bdellovibrionales bacterium]